MKRREKAPFAKSWRGEDPPPVASPASDHSGDPTLGRSVGHYARSRLFQELLFLRGKTKLPARCADDHVWTGLTTQINTVFRRLSAVWIS